MKKVLKVEGMMCPRCVAHVQKALEEIAGVESVEVNLKKKTATVNIGENVSDEALSEAIVKAGYEVKKIS